MILFKKYFYLKIWIFQNLFLFEKLNFSKISKIYLKSEILKNSDFQIKIFFEKNKFQKFIFIRIDLSARETFKNGISFDLTPSETGDTTPSSWWNLEYFMKNVAFHDILQMNPYIVAQNRELL